MRVSPVSTAAGFGAIGPVVMNAPVRPLSPLLLALLVGCADAVPSVPLPATLPSGCGDVPAGYVCEGSRWRYCEHELASSLDCARYTEGRGTCGATLPGYGFACTAPVGAPCRMAVPHGGHDDIHFVHCGGAAAGCVLRVTADHELTSACTEGFAPCAADTTGACQGDRLVTRCERGQPVAYDCTSYGGRCDPAIPACVGVVEGRRCGGSFQCAPGLRCQPLPGRRGVNTCVRDAS